MSTENKSKEQITSDFKGKNFLQLDGTMTFSLMNITCHLKSRLQVGISENVQQKGSIFNLRLRFA